MPFLPMVPTSILLATVVMLPGLFSSKPAVFVIGDSISMHYGPHLEKSLAPFARYARKEGASGNLDNAHGANGGDSEMVLGYLREKLADRSFSPDILLINCGLHDIKTNGGNKQVPPEDYRENLEQIIKAVKSRRIKPVWVLTTPVVDTVHNRRAAFKRFNADVLEYNAIARSVMEGHGVPVIDLYSFCLPLVPDAFIDHVHYKTSVREKQADFIAGFVAAHLKHTTNDR